MAAHRHAFSLPDKHDWNSSVSVGLNPKQVYFVIIEVEGTLFAQQLLPIYCVPCLRAAGLQGNGHSEDATAGWIHQAIIQWIS